MKTADLERSKRLKSAGWKQEGCFWWLRDPISGEAVIYDNRPSSCEPMSVYCCRAITVGEMIEWLIKDNTCKVEINSFDVYVVRGFDGMSDVFEINDNLCNALADAVIWVLERKGV